MALALEDIACGTVDDWMQMPVSYQLAQARRDQDIPGGGEEISHE